MYDPEKDDRFDPWEYEHTREEYIEERLFKLFRKPKHPDPLEYQPIDYSIDPEDTLREQFRDTGLQIIVKMASIELTPEKPHFPGGNWHLEGQLNEHIVGTAIYYLSTENVTPSRLRFRMATDHEPEDLFGNVGQDAYSWMEEVYGTSFGAHEKAPALQNYGSVETREGRLLAFPNVFQHCVTPFELVDPTKPGHRRFIALWLVDPFVPIISTANVPPQQAEWGEGGATANPELEPDDEWPMTREEALKHREALMAERSVLENKNRDEWLRYCYDFCEH